MDISSGRCVSRVSPDTYCTITVAKIAEDVGLSKRTVNRVLTLLAYFKLLEVTPQKKRHVADCLLVTAAIRKIADKFFALYGLLEALRSDRKYQEIHGKPIHIKVCVAKIFLAEQERAATLRQTQEKGNTRKMLPLGSTGTLETLWLPT